MLPGAGIHSAAPGCEYFRGFVAWWVGFDSILQRPLEVISNIHHTQLGKKDAIKNTTRCPQKSPRYRQGRNGCECVCECVSVRVAWGGWWWIESQWQFDRQECMMCVCVCMDKPFKNEHWKMWMIQNPNTHVSLTKHQAPFCWMLLKKQTKEAK